MFNNTHLNFRAFPYPKSLFIPCIHIPSAQQTHFVKKKPMSVCVAAGRHSSPLPRVGLLFPPITFFICFELRRREAAINYLLVRFSRRTGRHCCQIVLKFSTFPRTTQCKISAYFHAIWQHLGEVGDFSSLSSPRRCRSLSSLAPPPPPTHPHPTPLPTPLLDGL